MKNNLTNRGRQYDSSSKLQIHRRPQPCMCLLNIVRVVRNKNRPEPVLVQNSGHDDDDKLNSPLDVLYEMVGR